MKFSETITLQEWRDAVLANLREGGPVCQHAAQYVTRNDVGIGFARQSTAARWTMDGRIELSSRRYSVATRPASPRLLGSIVHEAKHLEQGISLALSVEGEVGGWTAEFLARAELGTPIRNPHWKAVARAPDELTKQDLREARSEMLKMTGWRYLIWLLPLRPNVFTALADSIGRTVAGRKNR